MSKSIQRISFGQIDNCPVVVGAGQTYVYNATNKRWRHLSDRRKQEVIPVKPATFLRRFGGLVERLPRTLRDLAPPLRIVSESVRAVGYCRTGSTGYFQPSEQAGGHVSTLPIAIAKVTQLTPFIAKRRREQDTFDLGRHHYLAGPGSSWSCHYRITREDIGGEFWDIQSTSEDSEEYESMGTHSLEAAQEYFDGVGFSISRKRWEAMGAKFPVDDLEDDDSCMNCGRSLSVYQDRRGYHRCEVD